MKMRRHLSLNIQGALRNYKNKSMKGLFQDENDRDLSDAEAKKYLNECLGKGWRVIKLGVPDTK